MSYLVLARKHRPQRFEEVVGQEHVTKTLAGALASGRVAHAFCFTGPRGVGKTSVARILAKALNCQDGPTPTPCGQCPACREIEAGQAVDVQEIDAASNSRVEDVRELREVIRYRPQAARYRVTILDEVHMLSKAAFNALLKTLEEPPEHAVFILATTDVHKVPLTILSRCQRYDFRRLPPRLLAEHLARVLEAEGTNLPAESLALMAREADGSVRDALSLLDQVLSLGRESLSHQEVVELLGLVDRELVRTTARAVLEGDAARVLELVEQVYAAGGEMQTFYAALQEHFRNLAAALAAPEGAALFGLEAEELAELRREAAHFSPESLHEVFDHLARSEELFRRAAQPRLVMEMTLLKLTQIKPVLSLEDILARLGSGDGGEEDGGESEESSQGPAPRPAPQQDSAAGPAAARGLAEMAGREGYPRLASYLGQGEVLWEEGLLVVRLPATPLARELVTEENQRRLEDMARQLWPEVEGLRLEAAPAPEEEPAKPPADREAQRAAELADHPAVREAVEVFEAQVVALNPTPGQS